jgi:hypothetical protein
LLKNQNKFPNKFKGVASQLEVKRLDCVHKKMIASSNYHDASAFKQHSAVRRYVLWPESFNAIHRYQSQALPRALYV